MQAGQAHLQRLLEACTAASMLLLVKQFLLAAYALSEERVRQFHPADGEQRKAEEKAAVSMNPAARLRLDGLDLDCAASLAGLEAQGTVGLQTNWGLLMLQRGLQLLSLLPTVQMQDVGMPDAGKLMHTNWCGTAMPDVG